MRLERPGIEPGTARLVRFAVDTIDTPQRLPIASSSLAGKTYFLTFSNGAGGNVGSDRFKNETGQHYSVAVGTTRNPQRVVRVPAIPKSLYKRVRLSSAVSLPSLAIASAIVAIEARSSTIESSRPGVSTSYADPTP